MTRWTFNLQEIKSDFKTQKCRTFVFLLLALDIFKKSEFSSTMQVNSAIHISYNDSSIQYNRVNNLCHNFGS